MENNLYYKHYGNRAIPESQHSLYCFRSKIRNAINIIVEKNHRVECEHTSKDLRQEVGSRAPISLNVSQWHVMLSQACVPLQSCLCSSPPCPVALTGCCKITCAGAGTLLEPLLNAVLLCSWMQPAQDKLVLRPRNYFASFF